MKLKNTKDGKRIFNEIVNSKDFREIIKDREQFLVINKNGAIMAECTIKLTEWLVENWEV